jgi:hypothetical protein
VSSMWTGPVPLATPHLVSRWRDRVDPQLTLNRAYIHLRQFLLQSVVAVPPHWVRTKPGASYLVCPSDPDVCIPVRDGYALTVLVQWMARGVEARSAAA